MRSSDSHPRPLTEPSPTLNRFRTLAESLIAIIVSSPHAAANTMMASRLAASVRNRFIVGDVSVRGIECESDERSPSVVPASVTNRGAGSCQRGGRLLGRQGEKKTVPAQKPETKRCGCARVMGRDHGGPGGMTAMRLSARSSKSGCRGGQFTNLGLPTRRGLGPPCRAWYRARGQGERPFRHRSDGTYDLRCCA